MAAPGTSLSCSFVSCCGAGGVFHPKALEIVPVTEPKRDDAIPTTPGEEGT